LRSVPDNHPFGAALAVRGGPSHDAFQHLGFQTGVTVHRWLLTFPAHKALWPRFSFLMEMIMSVQEDINQLRDLVTEAIAHLREG
jgi:hypothetical protein